MRIVKLDLSGFKAVIFVYQIFLKECVFTYLRSFAMRSHPENPFHERKPLSRMWTSTLSGMNLILAAVKEESPLRGLRIDFSVGIIDCS